MLRILRVSEDRCAFQPEVFFTLEKPPEGMYDTADHIVDEGTLVFVLGSERSLYNSEFTRHLVLLPSGQTVTISLHDDTALKEI